METETTKTEGGNGGKGTALAVVREARAATYEPRDIGEGITLAEQLARSCLLGRNLDTPEKVFAIIVAGRELGLSPMTALRSIHLVEGKPVMSADTMVGLVRGSGLCEYFRLVESTDEVATYEAKRKDTGDLTRLSFKWSDAQRAGLAAKDVWVKYRATMLRHRCAAMVARELFGDVMLNVYEQGEEDEIAARVTDVTPPHSGPRTTPTGEIVPRKAAPPARVVEPAPARIDPNPTIAPPTHTPAEPRTLTPPGAPVAVRVVAPSPKQAPAPPPQTNAAPMTEPHCGHYQLHVPKIGKRRFDECTAEELGSFIGWQEAMRDRGEWKEEYKEKNERSLVIAREWRAWREWQAGQATPAADDDGRGPPPEDAPPVGATADDSPF